MLCGFLSGLIPSLSFSIFLGSAGPAFGQDKTGQTTVSWTKADLPHLRAAAEAGDTRAMVELGRQYRFGSTNVSQNTREAIKWFRQASEKSDSKGTLNLASMYCYVSDAPRDYDKAAELYRAAAEHGEADAMFELYLLYARGNGVAEDRAEADRWLKKGAEAGSGWAQAALGRNEITPRTDRPSDISSGLRWIKAAANQENPRGQYELGSLYLLGEGVEMDEERGLELIRKSCDQDYKQAILKLAELYAAGVGEPRSKDESPTDLFIHAANHRSPEACEALFERFKEGVDGPRDLVRAAYWYTRAVTAGSVSFSLNGKLHRRRDPNQSRAFWRGVEGRSLIMRSHNPPQTDEFLEVLAQFLKAALPAERAAAMQISDLYEQGRRHVPKDAYRAFLWMLVAQQRGETVPAQKLIILEQSLSEKQKAEAKEHAPALNSELISLRNQIEGQN
jgi:TPR repeat protein